MAFKTVSALLLLCGAVGRVQGGGQRLLQDSLEQDPSEQLDAAACDLPPFQRNTREIACARIAIPPAWSFNQESGKCEKWYPTCGDPPGNRFRSKEQCEGLCEVEPDRSACDLPPFQRNTREIACTRIAIPPAWSYNQESGNCEKWDPGCEAPPGNRFRTEEQCEDLCEVEAVAPVEDDTPDEDPKETSDEDDELDRSVCDLPPFQVNTNPTLCARILLPPEWSYNPDSGKCEMWYPTCGAPPGNRFRSKEKCEGLCE